MLFINGKWTEGQGEAFRSTSPIDDSTLWSGCEADEDQVRAAFESAAHAQQSWSRFEVEDRYQIIERFANLVDQEKTSLGEMICREVGKPLKESIGEVSAVVAKCALTHQAMKERRADQSHTLGARHGNVTHRPLGVVAVYGPFNFPMHIANGQIVPALLAGNSVVFKPSELTPWSAEAMVKLWEQAGLPPGVLNLVQGGIRPGQSILKQPELRGLFFTGSRATGIKLRQALASRLEVLLALELGGNNAMVVHEPESAESAAEIAIQSAFLSAGQRCTCVRRLIMTDSAEGFSRVFVDKAQSLSVSDPLENPDAMMGSLVNASAVENVLAEQQRLVELGGKSLVTCQRSDLGDAFVTPGIIDVTDCAERVDDELFGPLVKLIRVPDLDTAIGVANDTEFGLAAGLVCQNKADFERFRATVNAGLINWNLPTTGASGRLPFGGLGHSGNHRPAGFYAIDFCNHAIAELWPADQDD